MVWQLCFHRSHRNASPFKLLTVDCRAMCVLDSAHTKDGTNGGVLLWAPFDVFLMGTAGLCMYAWPQLPSVLLEARTLSTAPPMSMENALGKAIRCYTAKF